ncbi:unnamed protein product [Nezara viridula]|uniref:Mitochondrial cytochrome c oxidase subunit VIc/VIIs domain-containing protein n=1 Tax=Nezara viridula TaxID=85310 RepID=A0A9P0EF77_NEZVI|nr:unnamed protein product [Nezara viridula]
MADIPAKLSKPQMRRLLQSQIKTNLFVAIGLGIVTGVAVKYLVCEPRKQRYAAFYRNYNPETAFYDMVKAGADFQSYEG